MRTILLDESVPRGVVKMLAGPDLMVNYAPEMGLAGADDSEMLRSAGAIGADVFVTCDQNLTKQQKIGGLRFGIVVVCTNNWPTILGNRDLIEAACMETGPGSYREVLEGAHVTRYGRSPKVVDTDH